MEQPADIVLVRGGIIVRLLREDDVVALVQVLDTAEYVAGAPLVDEAERQRLEATSEPGAPWPEGWVPIGAFRGANPVGFAAFVTTTADGDAAPSAHGDAASLVPDPARAVLGALLGGARELALDRGIDGLQLWVRQASDRDVDAAEVEGFEVARRLGVLGRNLDEPLDQAASAAHRIRPYCPEEDDEAVVEVLAAAYADTPEAGWTLEGFRQRRTWSWFEPEDLLVAEGGQDGRIDGLHWLKRRDETTGEVYNLAIHPRAQGSRLGPALLTAGLRHLNDIGCTDVVLWVDRANERAVTLYERHGFTTLWDDIAFRARPS